MEVRFYQYSNHGFTRCKLIVYRKQGHLRSFISVCCCGNEKIVHPLLRIHFDPPRRSTHVPWWLNVILEVKDMSRCAKLCYADNCGDDAEINRCNLIIFYIHRCCINHRTCLGIMHETEKDSSFFIIYFSCFTLCV